MDIAGYFQAIMHGKLTSYMSSNVEDAWQKGWDRGTAPENADRYNYACANMQQTKSWNEATTARSRDAERVSFLSKE